MPGRAAAWANGASRIGQTTLARAVPGGELGHRVANGGVGETGRNGNSMTLSTSRRRNVSGRAVSGTATSRLLLDCWVISTRSATPARPTTRTAAPVSSSDLDGSPATSESPLIGCGHRSRWHRAQVGASAHCRDRARRPRGPRRHVHRQSTTSSDQSRRRGGQGPGMDAERSAVVERVRELTERAAGASCPLGARCEHLPQRVVPEILGKAARQPQPPRVVVVAVGGERTRAVLGTADRSMPRSRR